MGRISVKWKRIGPVPTRQRIRFRGMDGLGTDFAHTLRAAPIDSYGPQLLSDLYQIFFANAVDEGITRVV